MILGFSIYVTLERLLTRCAEKPDKQQSMQTPLATRHRSTPFTSRRTSRCRSTACRPQAVLQAPVQTKRSSKQAPADAVVQQAEDSSLWKSASQLVNGLLQQQVSSC
jgi:hypothetical protein